MAFAVDGEEDFVEVPFIAWLGAPAPQLIGICLPELAAPIPHSFVGQDDTSSAGTLTSTLSKKRRMFFPQPTLQS